MLKIVLMLVEFLISIYKSETEAHGKELQLLKERQMDYQNQFNALTEKNKTLQEKIDLIHRSVVEKEEELENIAQSVKIAQEKLELEELKIKEKSDSEAIRNDI